ncbi:MAG: glycine--tRNA ligase subunit beta [Candidatus Dadabacteria bacterium]|nr:glycine--tRNA ligase subunit beta [Candidatus Dadabacteria bacterium]NIS08623.1 glycine--tRNA ligase subunit beta [Candidatus Dadabacteria bacterium]NIV42457.1 glycine--tRNA ligase subunit beta [Candidatus Dadabacteria bacterium]NIX15339.1 glycine--tRNA ligase subunit beta [Candidatus Dadabacteria bacterium]NIY21998.1 glycine--tRNA ligase subunit beta [Candidatus Dadabacteria bacterium]
MDKDLILEIGTEEIPAGFLEDSSKKLKEITTKVLSDSNLSHSDVEVYYTPRRLTLRVSGLPEKQEDIIQQHTGPPESIAYDDNKNPSKAAIGFAKKFGKEAKGLRILKTDRGRFLGFTQKIKGRHTGKILKEILPDIVLKIPFPKSMRWRTSKITFARPIRWVLCIFNNKPLKFTIYNITSSNKSYGHRFLSPKSFKVENWKSYLSGLEDSFVVLDQDKRSGLIEKEVAVRAAELNGSVEEDTELLKTVSNIVEYPIALIGTFEEEYLEVPPEVLVSVMKYHQKYFPVYRKNSSDSDDTVIKSIEDIKKVNTLLPNFIFISGIKVDKPEVVIKGNERVIRARFNDARFFLREDTKQHLENYVDKLKTVTYLSDVGSYYDKKSRLEAVSRYISNLFNINERSFIRAAELCKADLVTQMVFEFPELQGTMGKYYALISGETSEVATAIEEHYMPVTRDGQLPATELGSYLSIAEKIDNICSCFFAGLIPTGSADPYALRRQVIGIIRIITDKNIDLNIKDLINSWIENCGLDMSAEKQAGLPDKILGFFTERFRNYLLEEHKFDFDVIDAALSTNFENITDSLKVVETITSFKDKPDFESVTTAFKRVVNITKDSEPGAVDESLFADDAELTLYEKYLSIKNEVSKDLESADYEKVLSKIVELRIPVDNFFDSVMVMDKKLQIKNNRLSLLHKIKTLFFNIADFSKLN